MGILMVVALFILFVIAAIIIAVCLLAKKKH